MLNNRFNKNAFLSWCLFLGTLTGITSAATGQVIDEWLVAGPVWGRGGVAGLSNGYESRLAPSPGDLTYDFRSDARRMRVWEVKTTNDGWLDFFSSDYPQVQARWKDGAYPWAGAAMYAVKYIEADLDMRANLKIDSPQKAIIWINGEAIDQKDGQEVKLNQGSNRLVVKIPSPSKVRGVEPKMGPRSNWSLRVEVTPAQKSRSGANALTFHNTDPERNIIILDDGQPLRLLATLGTQNNQFPIFIESQAVRLPYRVEIAVGPAENYAVAPERTRSWPWVYTVDPNRAKEFTEQNTDRVTVVPQADWQNALPAAVRITLLDYDLRVLEEDELRLSFKPADNSSPDLMVEEKLLKFESLPIGHYTLVSEFVTREGKVWARDNDHSFSVIRGPVDTDQDDAIRYLGNIGHHLANASSGVAERVEWLHKVGITRQFKLSQSWSRYGVKHDGKGNVEVTRSENIVNTARLLHKAGITPVGDLIVGSIARKIDKSKTPALTAEDQEAARVQAELVGEDEMPFIQPPSGPPLPAFGTEAFEKTVYDYAYKLVDTYKDQITYWSGMNEIDLHATGSRADAIILAEAQKIAYRAAKDADPNAIIIAPSLVRSSEFVDMLFEAGFGEGADILDVHAHPANVPDLHVSTVLGNTGSEGLGAVRPYLETSGVDKPVWYGEISAPLAHAPRGVKGQAEAVVKQLCWAIASPHVESINYLVMYNSPTYWGANLGFNNFYGEPHPAVNAINTASHLIDGRQLLQPLRSIPDKVSHLRFSGPDGTETIVVWADDVELILDLRVAGSSVSAVDVIGRSLDLKVTHGRVRVPVGVSPVYVNASEFAD